jgi:hypothetical protein
MIERPPHKEPYAVSYSTYMNHRCRCAGCTDHYRIKHKEWRARASQEQRAKLNRRTNLRKQEQNGLKSMEAPNRGKPWTDEDRTVVMNPDYTAMQAAEMLGRTPFAVKWYRSQQRKKSDG